MLAAGRDDEQLAALCLPPGYSELALKMPPPVRNLVVFNAEPSTVAVNDVLAGLGLPAVSPQPAIYPGLRSLALLNLLPKSTGPESQVLHVQHALEPAACAQLRAAVDEASFSAADSVDGCTDYQLNLTRGELERLVGEPTVAHLWGLAHRALREFRGEAAQSDDDDDDASGGDDDGSMDMDDDEGMEEAVAAEAEAEQAPAASSSPAPPPAPSPLDAHEIFVRRYTADTRPWFPFHRDRSELTINVALADDELHGGGRLICLLDGAVKRVERTEGCATVHPSSFMHAVSRMTTGTRYSLIIFMGRSERIVAFNQEVRRLRHDGPSGQS